MKTFLSFALPIACALALAPTSQAGDTSSQSEEPKVSDETARVESATTTLEEVIGIPEGGIPRSMLENAAAIIVIPNLVKASFIVGARRGEGLISIRSKHGWTHPAFVNMTGGSVGWQAGISSTDLVLVFMNEKNVKSLLDGEFTLGADAAIAAGPVGRKASAGTNLSAQAEVYSYSRSSGLFAGIAIEGSQLGIDDDATARFYGVGLAAKDVLYGSHPKAPESAEKFKSTLNQPVSKS